MKWLNSLDELLYEVMSWLIFFPLTLWRAIVHPLAMMDYADRQLDLPEDEQYAAAVSPPLFLALALLIAHGVATALGERDAIVASRHGLAGLINDDATALVLRIIVFAALPLLASARLIRRRGETFDRRSLRLPFYAQCYPTGVFALGLGLATSLAQSGHATGGVAGGLLAGVSILHYAALETRWFVARLGIGYASAGVAVFLLLLEGLAVVLLVGLLLTH